MEQRHMKGDALRSSTAALAKYCEEYNWAGFDPYDALNSRLYLATPLFRSRLCNIAVTQVMKRIPVNLRPLLLVPRKQNPKALALFLSAHLKLYRLGLLKTREPVRYLVQRIAALPSPNERHFCWGYSFPWQTRGVLVPSGAANLVCTCFVANALLDVYEEDGDTSCLAMAKSAAEYILTELYWEDGHESGFSYPLPGLRIQVPNANFLASALLCRVYHHCQEVKFLDPALRVARHSVRLQQADGSWKYGELPTQGWIDNFHTGYNLCALHAIGSYASTDEFEVALARGFLFYKDHFFLDGGAPKYFHDKAYPLDIHCVAQSILTFLTLAHLHPDNHGHALTVADWAMRHMWDERGFFYYQIKRFYKNKISYMRWSQAWMLLAFSTLLEQEAKRPADLVKKSSENKSGGNCGCNTSHTADSYRP